MNIQDNISDMIIRIKNGQNSKKNSLIFKHSNLKENIIKVIIKLGFIKDINILNNNIKIYLKYFNNLPVIQEIKRISKPSLRIYYNFNYIKKIKFNSGVIIISTSKGILSDNEAKRIKIGGEPILFIR